MTACGTTERPKLVDRVPDASLIAACKPSPKAPGKDADDQTLATWVAELHFANRDCAYRHQTLVDWALKKEK